MSNILITSLSSEGTTDDRFLTNLISRVYQEIAFDCVGDIDVYDPFRIPFHKTDGFIDGVMAASKLAYKYGAQVLCIHVDSDNKTDLEVFENRIVPAFQNVENEENSVCKNLVPIVPIQMTESWMLADRELLREILETKKTFADLGLVRNPELLTDPKSVLKEFLRISQAHFPKKRDRLDISQLYQIIGQRINLQLLERLGSYQLFKQNAILSLKKLNYIH